MKYLIIPGNNALSHIGKCLAVESVLSAMGHEVLVAVSQRNEPFVQHLGPRYRVLPDIQETDQSGYPTMAWFRNTHHMLACMRAEMDLIQSFQPDRVLGIFRFTLKASAHLTGVPFDSLTCGCMLPETPDVIGFTQDDPEIARQRELFRMYFALAAARASQALVSLGLEPISDVRTMLQGDRTYLWDFPAFTPLPPLADTTHVGPISWEGWSYDRINLEGILANPRPMAVLTFGTCVGSAEVALRMIRVLRAMGYQVLLAAGGQEDLLAAVAQEPDVIACRFAPLHSILPHTALLACHGGQLTIFEAMAHRIPVLVMPFQPEQAHNGVCLERIGCGRRLISSQTFLGDSSVYVNAFQAMNDRALENIVQDLVQNERVTENLAAIQKTMRHYHGPETIASKLAEG